ncbi:MAG TPA: hypothetical protein VFR14_03655 [Candidatus Limnocylindrales bacterium]|nr:hypothetical protein [Candidatus Limnocylindrales bacterium]
MAIALLIAGPDADEPVVGPEAAARLADVGITRVALLGDGSLTGVVLEGWAFDPARIDEAVRAVYPTGNAGIRILHALEHVAVPVAPGEGRGR